MSNECEGKRALTPAKYPRLCTATADCWSEAQPHCYSTKATRGWVASYIQTNAFLPGSFGRVPQDDLFHILWVQVVFTTLSFLRRKNHCKHMGDIINIEFSHRSWTELGLTAFLSFFGEHADVLLHLPSRGQCWSVNWASFSSLCGNSCCKERNEKAGVRDVSESTVQTTDTGKTNSSS